MKLEPYDTLNFVPVIHKGTKEERIKIVNRIIEEIANNDRQFLSNHSDNHHTEDTKKISKFMIEDTRLYYIDYYRTEPIKSMLTQREHGRFCHGGTLWGLVNDFKDFIQHGRYSNHKHGYGGLYCGAWGYKEENMEKIRKLARELGYLMPTYEEDSKLIRIHTRGPEEVLLKRMHSTNPRNKNNAHTVPGARESVRDS